MGELRDQMVARAKVKAAKAPKENLVTFKVVEGLVIDPASKAKWTEGDTFTAACDADGTPLLQHWRGRLAEGSIEKSTGSPRAKSKAPAKGKPSRPPTTASEETAE